MPNTKRVINYQFNYTDGSEQSYQIELDNLSLDLITEPKKDYPHWTKLNCHKCSNCPLDEKTHTYCPVAVKLVEPLEYFRETPPSDNAQLSIHTPERTYSKNGNVQSAVASLISIHMATSGCPILDQLRPCVRFHIPFTTILDTTYRSLVNDLIAQYLLIQNGKVADWNLNNFSNISKSIDTVNKDFRLRLAQIENNNYASNAFISHQPSDNDIQMSLDSDAIQLIGNIFSNESYQGSQQPLSYKYQFNFDSKETKEFTINIDRKSLTYINKNKNQFPDWAQLQNNKCSNCPLDEKEHKYCPAAAAISETIEFFRKTLSIQEGSITIKSANRDYSKYATITDGISAMIGLVMASSGCPILSQLKPLVINHLPFGTQEETAYRSLGMYFLSQFYLAKEGQAPNWELNNLTQLYEEINTVNRAFCIRVRESQIEDASLNALVKLDCFAQIINFELSKGKIEKLQKLFDKYIGA